MSSAERPYGDLVGTSLRALTWNVWGRFGPWRQREDALVSTLRVAALDIVFLQASWVDDTGADVSPRSSDRLRVHWLASARRGRQRRIGRVGRHAARRRDPPVGPLRVLAVVRY
jgi:hypothetical protein